MKKIILLFSVIGFSVLFSCNSKHEEAKIPETSKDSIVPLLVQQPDGTFRKDSMAVPKK